MVAFSQIA